MILTEPNLHFNEIFERVKSKTDIGNFRQLADFIGTTQSYVSRKKGKNDFPILWAFTIGQEYGLSTDWILTGEEYKKSVVTNETINHKEFSENDKEIDILLKKIKGWLIELKRKNPKRVSWFECILEDKIPEYREWAEKERDEKRINEGSQDYPDQQVD